MAHWFLQDLDLTLVCVLGTESPKVHITEKLYTLCHVSLSRQKKKIVHWLVLEVEFIYIAIFSIFVLWPICNIYNHIKSNYKTVFWSLRPFADKVSWKIKNIKLEIKQGCSLWSCCGFFFFNYFIDLHAWCYKTYNNIFL